MPETTDRCRAHLGSDQCERTYPHPMEVRAHETFWGGVPVHWTDESPTSGNFPDPRDHAAATPEGNKE